MNFELELFSLFHLKFQIIRTSTSIFILIDSYTSVSTTVAHNAREAKNLKDQNVQSHNVFSPSKATLYSEPIIEKNAFKVDSKLDDLMNIEVE